MDCEKRESQRNLSIDFLNVLSCFAVIVLHCSGDVEHFSATPAWGVSLFLQTIAHWAVAVFFMISGATLLGYRTRYSTKIFFQKRFFHVVLPFLLWSAIYLFYNSYFRHSIHVSNFTDAISLFLNGQIVSIFYFFYHLIGIYLVVPVVSLLADKRYQKLLLFVIILGFFGTAFLRDFTLWTKFQITADFEIPLGKGYMCFFLAGWYLSQYRLTYLKRKILYVLGILSFIVMFGITYIRSYQLNHIYSTLRSYFSICNFLMAAAVFVFIEYFHFKKIFGESFCRVITKLSSTSLGVYLVQMIYFPIVWKFFNTYSVWYMLLAPIPIYFISVMTVFIIKKIPLLNWLIP